MMFKNARLHKAERGFTLIELLVVIGLLGALTALVLPSLMADREEAMGDVCDYNQAGTVRVLHQYNQLTGAYPVDMHTGFQGATGTPDAMEGLPGAQTDHMVTSVGTTRHALTADEAASLRAAGIASVCYDTGLNSTSVTQNVIVACASDGTNSWNADDGNEMTFDGVLISDYCAAATSPDGKAGIVVALWIAPTTNWSNTAGTNQDWGNGAVSMGIDLEGQCPIPQEAASGDEVSFAYYMAYFKVCSDGSAATMIGSTCPECGVLNP